MSPSKVNVPSDISVASQTVTISEIKDLLHFKSISVTAEASKSINQSNYLMEIKQVIQLADYTGAVNLVLWEEDVGMLETTNDSNQKHELRQVTIWGMKQLTIWLNVLHARRQWWKEPQHFWGGVQTAIHCRH